MKQIIRLVWPEKIEAWLFFVLAITVLLLENAKKFWSLLNGNSVAQISTFSGPENSISNWLDRFQNHINPRLVDFIVWLLVGCLVFILASLMITMIKNTDSEMEFLHYYKSPSGRKHEIIVFLTKIAVRLAGLFAIILWLNIFIRIINHWLVGLLFTPVISPKNPISWLWLVVSLLIMALCLYAFAIFARLVLLKPRVLGKAQE